MELATARMAFFAPRRLLMRKNCARRYPSFLRVAAHAAFTKVGLSHGELCRVRVDRRLPALSSSRGQNPAHEIRCPTDGKRLMSVPISATRTRAVVPLRPGMVVKRLTAARKGPSV